MPDNPWNLSTTSTHTLKFCKIVRMQPAPGAEQSLKSLHPFFLLLHTQLFPSSIHCYYCALGIAILQYCNWCNWDGMHICRMPSEMWPWCWSSKSFKCPLLCNDAAWTIFKIFQVPAFVHVCAHISQFYQFPLVHLLLQCLQVKAGCKSDARYKIRLARM